MQHIFDEKSHKVDLKLSHSVKSLGVTLHEHMTLEHDIRKTSIFNI